MNYLQKKKQAIIMMLAAQIIKTAQGYPVTVNDCESGTAVDYTVWGNTVADGDTVMYVGDKTKNLIPYPYHESTKTVNGITFTDNGDGSITVNGTATNKIFYHLVTTEGTNALKLSAAKYYFSDNCNSSSSPRRFLIQAKKRVNSGWTNLLSMEGGNGVFDITKLECDCIWVVLVISAGDTFDNVTFKPQLKLGTTATEYEPYGYKIPIVNLGKNLLSYPYNFTTRTENGLTFTDNGDGSITINGTATIQTGFMFRNQIIDAIDKAKAYVLSGGEDGNIVLRIDFYNGTTWKNLVNTGNDGKAIIDFTKMNFDYTRVSVALVVKANTVCDNITIKPQLELGETATEYEPYRVPVTANIYLDEPLRKIGDYADYIDFKGQRVVRKVGVLDNTSTKPISESLVALAIPTEEPIPLPALKTFKGTNIISVDTSVQPSNIKAKYVRL